MVRVACIDHGTTYSAVAYVKELCQPEILTNRDGERQTPTVVMFQDQEPLIGKKAKRSMAMALASSSRHRHTKQPGYDIYPRTPVRRQTTANTSK